jgi:hypothetical protein
VLFRSQGTSLSRFRSRSVARAPDRVIADMRAG